MNVYEFVFVLCMIVFFGSLLLKLYNLLTAWSVYNLSLGFVLFVAGMLSFLIGFFVLSGSYSVLLYSRVLVLMSVCVVLLFLFTFLEVLGFVVSRVRGQVRGAYNSLEEGRR